MVDDPVCAQLKSKNVTGFATAFAIFLIVACCGAVLAVLDVAGVTLW